MAGKKDSVINEDLQEQIAVEEDGLTDEDTYDAAFLDATGESQPQDDDEEQSEDDLSVLEDEAGDSAEESEEPVEQLDDKDSLIKKLQEEVEKANQRYRSFEGRYWADRAKLEKELEIAKSRPAPMPTREIEPDAPQDTEAFFAEYPDFKKPIMDVVNRIVKQELNQALAPVQQKLYATDEERHFAKIHSAHPDWKTVVGSSNFKAWFESLDAIAGPTVQQYLASGTADQVISVFNKYKAETQQKQETPATEQDLAPAGGVDPRIDKLRGALAVRPGHSGAPKTQARGKAQTYDEAWEEAARKA